MLNIEEKTVSQRITDVFVKKLKVSADKVGRDTHVVNDLRVDSLEIVELIMEIESEFDIQIPDEEVVNIFTFQQIVDNVKQKLAEKSK